MLWFFFLVGVVKAETLKVYKGEKIVVTATRSKQCVKDVSASVSVLTEDELKSLEVKSCTDALSILSGVFIQKTGDFGRADVEIRGIGSRGRRIGVLIDGRPEKMALFGCAVTHYFPLINVKRIEVVRGAFSNLYGSDALGGVINIITKTPENKFEGNLSLKYGSYNTKEFLFETGSLYKNLFYYLTIDRRKSDGHLPSTAYDGKDYELKVGCRLPKLNLTFSTKYFDGYKEEPDTSWTDYERGAYDFTLKYLYKGEHSLKFYRTYGEHLFSDGWHSKDKTDGIIYNSVLKIFKGNEILIGAEYKTPWGERLTEDGDSVLGEWDRNSYAFYTHINQKFPRFIISAGIRYDVDNICGSFLSPRVGIVAKVFPDLLLRASAGKGFRYPQLNELYMFPPSDSTLKPEKATNYEAGINYTYKFLNFDIVYYLIKGEELIELSRNPSPPPLYKFTNTGKFEFKGIELNIMADFDDVKGRISYTYLDPGIHTKGRAKHKLDFLFLYKYKPVIASINAQYVKDYYAEDSLKSEIGDYLVVNSKVNFDIHRFVGIFFAINNIFDEKYEIYVDLPGGKAGLYEMPGRRFTIGVNVKYR